MSISEGTGLWYKISRSKPQDTEPEIFTLDILSSAQSRQQGSLSMSLIDRINTKQG